MNRQGSILAAFGGHLVDLYRMTKFSTQNPHSYSKLRQIIAVARRTNAKTVVETGTYLGNTADRLSRYFEKVITIEVDSQLHAKAKQFLSNRQNVECILGDCEIVLPELFADRKISDCLVFLDGHLSGGETSMGQIEEPAIAQISSLGKYTSQIAALVIDDFRTFIGRDGTPRKSDVIRSLEDTFPTYGIFVQHDQILVERQKS